MILPARKVTAEAPINIAVIKYWGKSDQNLNIPTNDSLSITLQTTKPDGIALTSRTSIEWAASDDHRSPQSLATSTLRINDKPPLVAERDSRLYKCLAQLVPSDRSVTIASHNGFPTAAGLASSASGYAALSVAAAALAGIKDQKRIAVAARLGSGSACRSLYGGFVQWTRGSDPATGLDSQPLQIHDESHWQDLRCLVVVLSGRKKEVSSTEGMLRTKDTSALFQHRIACTAASNLAAIKEAISAKDFASFARITMQDSNQFHATCLDSFPPVFYLSAQSQSVIGAIHQLNESQGKIIAGYTFDAGPNAFVFCQEASQLQVEQAICAALKTEHGLDLANEIIPCRVGPAARLVSIE